MYSNACGNVVWSFQYVHVALRNISHMHSNNAIILCIQLMFTVVVLSRSSTPSRCFEQLTWPGVGTCLYYTM